MPWIFGQVNGSRELGIMYERSSSSGLVAYAYSDYANSSDRASVSEGRLKPNVIRLSSTEVEYVAMGEVVKKAHARHSEFHLTSSGEGVHHCLLGQSRAHSTGKQSFEF